jgi:hypothetical protein
MKLSLSQTEKNKLKYFLNKKTILSEQKWLDDVIAAAKNVNTSLIKNTDVLPSFNFTKNLDELSTKFKIINDNLNLKKLFKLDEINNSKKIWKDTISDYTKYIFSNSDLNVDTLTKYVTNEITDLPNDVLKKLTDNQISIISVLKAQDEVFNLEIDNTIIQYKKLLDEKVKKFKEIHGEEKYKEIFDNLKNKKITSEEFFIELDKLTPEKKSVEQVAGVKLSDIPKDEYDIIDASLKKYGLDKDWGFDSNTGEPVYVTLNINGENVKFTLNKQGPEQFNNTKINDDGLENLFRDEYEKTFPIANHMYPPNVSGNRPYILDWIKSEKILKDPDLRKKYVYRYDVPLGVRMYADDVQGNWGQWVIINPEAISNYRKPKNLEELKDSIFHVIYHELTHVVQKVSNQSYASYKSGGFQSGKEAWGYLTGKRSKYYYKNQVIPGEKPSVNFWDWWHSDENNVETLIRKFGAEKNIDTSKDYSWRDDFDEWALQNNEVPEKFIIQPKKQTVSNSNIINMYGDDVKSRVLRYKIDYWKNVSDEYAKIKTKTDGLSDEKLLKFIDNNIGIEEIDNIVKYAAQELSYFSHVKEIEAEFSANIKNLMELGTLEKNKGFATFLVDYLRGTNKSQKLADINIKKHNYDFNLELDAKYPNTKNINDVNTNKLKEFFKKFIDLFLKKNVANEIKLEKELKSVDGWVNNIPKDFFEVLSKLENEWKTIYPDQAKQLEKGLYKQAYELISKGYPALLPFIITGLDDTEEENKEEVKNESFLMKKNFLSEKEKKGLKTYLKKELLIKNKFF